MNDEFKISVLSSGSGGNCTYIETPQHKIIQDAGLSGIRIKRLMEGIGKDLADVDTMLVTHEHTDHAKGVGILARKYGMNVYANEATWKAMDQKIGAVPLEQKFVFDPNTTELWGDLDVESFTVAHDAAQAQFYNYHHHGKSFVIITDTGSVSDRVAGLIRNADAYLFECNYDPDMLMNGDYSYSTKLRINSDTGHLSNQASTEILMDVMGPQTKRIFLAHRSHHNNTKALARLTVASVMKNHGFGVGQDFELFDTDVEQPSPLIKL
ncbi:MBL fold metallo-hydrolase [Fructilactobacillus myrtifloralis]|uniref:MBL fold metallo-hydrolase n=1 Tax=Fructilactobacillus myrtifloralis TaxID=2940301 RepID=A0ABY5BQH0_9LACO|nr:MBL fold metallo-hydrolase [Fructilactobacillus myrtifloralis]USS84654.1 MBL fold metallo-hydrolase [Fructilactobacillus myrtifloralis]